MRRVFAILMVLLLISALATGLLVALFAPADTASDPGGLVRVEQIDAAQYPQLDLYVSVRDAAGNLRGDLRAEDFAVREDAVPVELIEVAGGGAGGPISAALVLDRSGSMEDVGKIDGAQAAALAFIEQLRPADQAAIVTFSDTVHASRGFTTDQARLVQDVEQLIAGGDTALYDAVIAGVDMLAEQPGRRVLLILTDGEDTNSDADLDEALEYAKAVGQPVYMVGLGGRGIELPFGLTLFSQIDEDVLREIAAESGGRYFYAPDAADLAALYAAVAGAVQQEYRLSYISPRPFYDGTRRNIEVSAAGITAGGAYIERHLINVASNPLVGLLLLTPLVGLLFLPDLLRRRRAAGAPPLVPAPAAAPGLNEPAPPLVEPTLIESAPVASARRCPSCEKPLRPNARFCPRCGNAVVG
ncbi:MAG: VWA domain-containing protein [Oscillochloris sp.]|nr:VWA domain-containing protein [Oscillochloris sp.]